MKLKIKEALPSLLVTLLLLCVLEILGSTFLPLIGIEKYRIPFNVLIVLFIGFKLESPFLSLMILIVQYFHSFFSYEGWAMGTVAGVVICLIISYLRELIHFSSVMVTVVVTQIFQMVWFVIVSSLLFLKMGEWTYILEKFWRFVPESIVISLIAPFFFSMLDKIWRVDESGMLGDQS